jgi:CheY-like chemotaxis protein
MAGKIWVESEPGKGSRFHFTVRMGLQKADSAKPLRIAPEQLRGLPVLVVDDNETNRLILTKILRNWNMEPRETDGGPAAIAALEAAQKSGRKYPLILLDAQMPEMDGFALAGHIKKSPHGASATVLMLSSAGLRGDAERCRQLGIAAYLTKPFKQSELLEAILAALGTIPQPDAKPKLITRHSLREKGAQGLRILVAEDNAVNQVLVVRLLEKRGHKVQVAANGKQALACLQHGEFDVVLMDVQMPRNGRPRSHRSHSRKRKTHRCPHPHHRHDGQRHERRRRGMPSSRYGRVRFETAQFKCAVRSHRKTLPRPGKREHGERGTRNRAAKVIEVFETRQMCRRKETPCQKP